MLQPALLGGLFNGILSGLPIVGAGNCCCCLWILAGGALAAWLDTQNNPGSPTPGRGAIVGLSAGIIGALVWLVVSLLLDPLVGEVQQRMLGELLRVAPDVNADVREALDSMSQERTPLSYVVGFSFMLFVGSVFSTIGGALAAMFFRKDVPPALGGPIGS